MAVFYRRYFEWLPSLDNELRKHRYLNVDHDWEGSIVSFIEEGYTFFLIVQYIEVFNFISNQARKKNHM